MKKIRRRMKYDNGTVFCSHCFLIKDWKVVHTGFNGDSVQFTEEGHCKFCKRVIRKHRHVDMFKDEKKLKHWFEKNDM